jgi:hypothetical protein
MGLGSYKEARGAMGGVPSNMLQRDANAKLWRVPSDTEDMRIMRTLA